MCDWVCNGIHGFVTLLLLHVVTSIKEDIQSFTLYNHWWGLIPYGFFACAGDEFFDASQYAFFGQEVAEEIELGGLDEEDGGEQVEDGDDPLDNIAGTDEVWCFCTYSCKKFFTL